MTTMEQAVFSTVSRKPRPVEQHRTLWNRRSDETHTVVSSVSAGVWDVESGVWSREWRKSWFA